MDRLGNPPQADLFSVSPGPVIPSGMASLPHLGSSAKLLGQRDGRRETVAHHHGGKRIDRRPSGAVGAGCRGWDFRCDLKQDSSPYVPGQYTGTDEVGQENIKSQNASRIGTISHAMICPEPRLWESNPSIGTEIGTEIGTDGTDGTVSEGRTGHFRNPPYKGGPNVPVTGDSFEVVPVAGEPLDTPPDWFARIAQRQREWHELGPETALRLWHARGDASRHVLHAMGVTP